MATFWRLCPDDGYPGSYHIGIGHLTELDGVQQLVPDKVVDLADGPTLLLCRVKDRHGLSHLCARSQNRLAGWQFDKEPTLMSSPKEYPEEIWGIEDPGITHSCPTFNKIPGHLLFPWRPGVSLALI